jgi:hypothetical protein
MEKTIMKKRLTSSQGFTLIELIIATVIMIFVVLAIGMALVDGQRGWNNMFNSVNSEVVRDGFFARKRFDLVLRRASREKFLIDPAGSWVEVYYYASDKSTVLDRYARLYTTGNKLLIEYGQLNPTSTLSTETVCENVSSCTFGQLGRSVQMVLKLDNGKQTNTVITSAATNN